MWTGLFTLQYKNFLVNLKGKVPAADLARVDPNALKWTVGQFNAANGPYVIPLENQFYIGFYNKTAFAKAGVSAVPTDWSQLFTACKKLKAAGYMPLVYGNGGQPLGAEFYPWYDMSYMMIGAHPVTKWQQLYSGQIPWTSAANEAQLAQWAKLKSNGCTNTDVLTKTNNLGEFESGKAAMMVDGTWDTQKFTSALGTKVAAFVPPFSATPIKGVVDFAGDGLSDDELHPALRPGPAVPGVHDDQPGREDHQRRGADPRHQRHVHVQPGQPGDAELRQPGSHDRLPDAGQRGAGQRGEHREQGAPLGAERHHLAEVGAVQHADHLGPAAQHAEGDQLPVMRW